MISSATYLLAALALSAPVSENPCDMTPYNVVWNSPSTDSSGSMPLGNGDIGLNAWIEAGGDLSFYISKSDAWSENARLLKIGRVRVSFSTNPFEAGEPFQQTLNLNEGAIEVRAGAPGQALSVRLWVDAHAPRVCIEAVSDSPMSMRVATAPWRTAERELGEKERFSAYGLAEGPFPVIVTPDTVLDGQPDRVVWFHRNERSMWRDSLVRQGLETWVGQAQDPLLHRTFGAIIFGEGFRSLDAHTLEAAPRKEHRASIAVLTRQTESAGEWTGEITALAETLAGQDLDAARDTHTSWWREFWNRSWIQVSGAPEAETVARGYALQRFISACAGRGAFPIKFNGSLFTVDAREKDEVFDADYRRWGGPYWFQNTRLPYWPMLASGDFEMLLPLFRMYADAMPLFKARTKAYFNHDGAYFPETMQFWGAYADDNYGWNREGKPISHIDNRYIGHYYSCALELLALMGEYHAFTGDDAFAREMWLPFAEEVLTFYDRHFQRDGKGKLVMEPAQSLETWQAVVNPLPDIAGLRWVIPGLLALPDELVSKDRRKAWRTLLKAVPDIPIVEKAGKPIIAPAEKLLEERKNSENAELYAVFPFRLYGLGQPDLQLARDTFARRGVKGAKGWQQDDTQAAFLGLTDIARDYIATRFSQKHEGSRFPAFWGPNFDWIPDQDHGGNGLMALQTMLLQTNGREILLFPAWPKQWDVQFRLHAPLGTTVQGRLESGKVVELTVTPEERSKDLKVMGPQ